MPFLVNPTERRLVLHAKSPRLPRGVQHQTNHNILFYGAFLAFIKMKPLGLDRLLTRKYLKMLLGGNGVWHEV